jgi:3-oxoacyl-[acyl-carrier-protein] synthase II
MKRVAITGIGVISPLGSSAAESFANAAAGRSAICRIDEPWSKRLIAPLAACANFRGDDHFAPPKLRMLDRVSQIAIVTAQQAIGDSCFDISSANPQRVGVFFGTGMGGSQTTNDGYQTLYGEQSDRIKPFTILMGMTNAPAAWIGIEYGITGPNLTYSTACSSSAVSIGEAWVRLRNGDLDVAIAGGAEAPLSFGALKAWEAMHTLASEDPDDASASCKPFSRNRSGMVLGEGAAIVVLEEWERAIKRGATIHGELIGYGVTTDVASRRNARRADCGRVRP